MHQASFASQELAGLSVKSMESKAKLYQSIVCVNCKELERRYANAEFHKIPEWSSLRLKDDHLQALRDFFLQYIYPRYELRKIRDEALTALKGIITRPQKLLPLLGIGFGTIRRLGFAFPLFLQIARHSVKVYHKSLHLENMLYKEACRQGIQSQSLAEQECHWALLASLDSEVIHALQRSIFHLFDTVKDLSLLETVLQSMRSAREVFASRKNLYSQDERDGLEHGLQMVEAGYRIFSAIGSEKIPVLIQAIQSIENNWYAKILSTR